VGARFPIKWTAPEAANYSRYQSYVYIHATFLPSKVPDSGLQGHAIFHPSFHVGSCLNDPSNFYNYFKLTGTFHAHYYFVGIL
jgi:hypothetical protein